MNKSEIKKIFREKKVQLGEGSMELIEDHIRREVVQMAQRLKDGNFKRLTPEHFHYALGDWGFESGSRKLTK